MKKRKLVLFGAIFALLCLAVLLFFQPFTRVDDTTRGTLTFQSAEFQQDCGFVDMIVERGMMRKRLSNILKLHGFPKETR